MDDKYVWEPHSAVPRFPSSSPRLPQRAITSLPSQSDDALNSRTADKVLDLKNLGAHSESRALIAARISWTDTLRLSRTVSSVAFPHLSWTCQGSKVDCKVAIKEGRYIDVNRLDGLQGFLLNLCSKAMMTGMNEPHIARFKQHKMVVS